MNSINQILLEDYPDDMIQRLRRIESVSNLRLYGVRKEQVTAYADRKELSLCGFSEKLVMTEIFGQSFSPGGSIKNDYTEYLIFSSSDKNIPPE